MSTRLDGSASKEPLAPALDVTVNARHPLTPTSVGTANALDTDSVTNEDARKPLKPTSVGPANALNTATHK